MEFGPDRSRSIEGTGISSVTIAVGRQLFMDTALNIS
jgi:hypothetical protein